LKYVVRWQPDALNDLATVWLSASSSDRAAITAAALEIERTLRFDAESKGESRSEAWRIVFSTPLAVRFEADPGTREVQIIHAWRFTVRPK
jgi:hypothetical protein